MNAHLAGHAGIGASVRRVEDHRFVTGAGRFTANRSPDGLAHAVFVRSPFAHARVASLDLAAAASSQGVLSVFDGRMLLEAGLRPLPYAPMLKRRDGAAMSPPPRLALAAEVVRFVGEAVACVIAETEWQALDAAEKIAIDWEPLDAVADVAAAAASNAVGVNAAAPDNVCGWYEHGDAEAVREAFEIAIHRVPIELVNNRLIAHALEPRAAVAEWDGARLTLTTACQMPQLCRQHLAHILPELAPENIRVIVRDIGGSFGAKTFIYPEYVAVAHAARRLCRPVSWVATRTEAFLSDCHGRDHRSIAELALDADLRFTALRVRTHANVGAYLSFLGAVIPTISGSKPLAGVYRIPSLHLQVGTVLTHTAPVEAYRGAGRPEAIYLLERLIDKAARALDVDPVDLRRRNMIGARELPYVSAMGETYDSGDFPRVMDAALAAADWNGFPSRQKIAAQHGRLAGRGMAYFIESTGAANPVESSQIVVTETEVTVFSGTQNMGQGLETSYAQIVVERLGVPMDQVRIVQGDTDQVPRGGGSGGSRSLFIGGAAIAAACDDLIAQAREDAPRANAIDWFELSRARGGPLRAEGKVKVAAFSWPNGCHVCEVEIDRETGEVKVTRFTAVDDVGVVVNPMIVHGQTHGGIAQGVGQALMEHIRHDPADGQLVTGSLMDYALPRALDLPMLEVQTDERSPCTTNPLGAKGAGEGGTIGSPPAVVNAILDALAGYGVAHLDMPITAEKIWRVMRRKPERAP